MALTRQFSAGRLSSQPACLFCRYLVVVLLRKLLQAIIAEIKCGGEVSTQQPQNLYFIWSFVMCVDLIVI